MGDVDGNGRIDEIDYLLALSHSFGRITLKGDAFIAADVNHDGIVDADDFLAISKHVDGYKIINEVIK
jgi:hypothetical protein